MPDGGILCDPPNKRSGLKMPIWNIANFMVLTMSMKLGDTLATRLDFSVEAIKEFEYENWLRLHIADTVGSIVLHGQYDHDTGTSVQTIIPCNNNLGTAVHIFSADFFSSRYLKRSWITALRLVSDITVSLDMSNTEFLRHQLGYIQSNRFAEITLISRDPTLHCLSHNGYETF